MPKTLVLLVIICFSLSACSKKVSLICEADTKVSPINPISSKVLISVYRNGDILEVDGMGIYYKGNANIKCSDSEKAGLTACKLGRNVFINIGNYPFETSQAFVIADETNVFSYGRAIKRPEVYILESADGICH